MSTLVSNCSKPDLLLSNLNKSHTSTLHASCHSQIRQKENLSIKELKVYFGRGDQRLHTIEMVMFDSALDDVLMRSRFIESFVCVKKATASVFLLYALRCLASKQTYSWYPFDNIFQLQLQVLVISFHVTSYDPQVAIHLRQERQRADLPSFICMD